MPSSVPRTPELSLTSLLGRQENGRRAPWPVTTRRLLVIRTVRSVGQGALIVTFALYLKALGWTAAHIGLLLTAGGLLNAWASILVGAICDRKGAKRFLLFYEAVITAAGGAALFSSSPALLVATSMFGGFGRGQNGGAGPFSPAESAWLADGVPPQDRGQLYSLNAALGFFGMAGGSVLAMLMPLWAHALPGASGFRPLFAPTVIGALLSALILARTPGGTSRRGPSSSHGTVAQKDADRVRRERVPAARGGKDPTERAWLRPLLLLLATNSFNGLAIGITSPLISYWFAVRFHVGPSRIGEAFLATFLLTGAASLATGKLTGPWGIVRSVVTARLAGLVLLVFLPLAPTYSIAAALYTLRSAFNRGTAGARQALAVTLAPEEHRGLAISLNAASMQLPSAVGPTIAGYLIQSGSLELPFYLAAGLQLIYLVLYLRLFRRYEPEPASPRPPRSATAAGESRC